MSASGYYEHPRFRQLYHMLQIFAQTQSSFVANTHDAVVIRFLKDVKLYEDGGGCGGCGKRWASITFSGVAYREQSTKTKTKTKKEKGTRKRKETVRRWPSTFSCKVGQYDNHACSLYFDAPLTSSDAELLFDFDINNGWICYRVYVSWGSLAHSYRKALKKIRQLAFSIPLPLVLGQLVLCYAYAFTNTNAQNGPNSIVSTTRKAKIQNNI